MCQGVGNVPYKETLAICRCVYRNVFRICMRKRTQILNDENFATRVSQSKIGAFVEIPTIDFVCDVEVLARKQLSPRQRQVFRYHYIYGVEYDACCVKFKVCRGNFFHECYRIEATLGKAFWAAGLFPTYGYLNLRAGVNYSKFAYRPKYQEMA